MMSYCPKCGAECRSIDHVEPCKTQYPFRCPVCNGQGIVSTPPEVAGDVPWFISTGTGTFACRACKGTGIIWGLA